MNKITNFNAPVSDNVVKYIKLRGLKQYAVNMNDIAIYIIDGECLIKQFKGDHLHSLNPEFDDIAFNEEQNIKCVGKVLGKA